jgi:hypothetical protein
MSVLISTKNHAGCFSGSEFVRDAARNCNVLVSGTQLDAKVLGVNHGFS